MIFGAWGDEDPAEDAFIPVHVPYSTQLMINALGALLKRWGDELIVGPEEMGEKVAGCTIHVFSNPKTGAVKLHVHDPSSPFRNVTPGVAPGHA